MEEIVRFEKFFDVDMVSDAAVSLLAHCGFPAAAEYDGPLNDIDKPLHAKYEAKFCREDFTHPYPDQEALDEEIINSLEAKVHDEKALEKYICAILMRLRYLGDYFFPGEDAPDDHFNTDFFQNLIRDYSYLDHKLPELFENRLRIEVENDPYGAIPESDWDKVFEERKEKALDEYLHIRRSDAFHIIYYLYRSLTHTASIIQSVLMVNGEKRDLFSYQQQCNVTIVDSLSIDDISIARQWTKKYTRSISPNYRIDDFWFNKTVTREIPTGTFPEIEHAKLEGLVSADNVLLYPCSEFVRFCVQHKYFQNYGRPAFRKIRNILKAPDGSLIDENKLAQAYCDLQRTKRGQ